MGIESIFGIGGPEFLFILILAGIFLGPGRIAKVARWMGQTTAKLQTISRGFLGQLKSELDMGEGTEDLRDMLKEMQDLRSEVSNLQNQISTTLSDATAETKGSLNQLAELTNSIRPPSFDADPIQEANEAKSKAEPSPILPKPIDSPKNGSSENGAAVVPPPLPTPLSIEDDLE
ncbi:MAG: sec-independent protein translocase protein TatB [Cellvibrionaceae bacterium]|jgi:sec-independent protein translocase protein TatB